jgi:hypothetical protein
MELKKGIFCCQAKSQTHHQNLKNNSQPWRALADSLTVGGPYEGTSTPPPSKGEFIERASSGHYINGGDRREVSGK